MEDVAARSSSIPPPLPPKTRNRAQQLSNSSNSSSSSGEILTTFTFPEMRSVNLVSNAQQQQQQQQQQPSHVVKIRINPDQDRVEFAPTDGCIRISVNGSNSVGHNESVSENSSIEDGMLRHSTEKVTSTVAATATPERAGAPYYFYNSFPSANMVISSGQSSPSDTLDSGTCSDLDGSTPPPLPKKTVISSVAATSPPAPPKASASPTVNATTVSNNTVTVTVNGGPGSVAPASKSAVFHQRNGSLTSSGAEVDTEDEEEDDDRISCDSLNSHDLRSLSSVTNDSGIVLSHVNADKITVNVKDFISVGPDTSADTVAVENMRIWPAPPPPPPPARSEVVKVPPPPPTPPKAWSSNNDVAGRILPENLLRDIRERSVKLNSVANSNNSLKKKLAKTWKENNYTTNTATVNGNQETALNGKENSNVAALQQKFQPLSIVPVYDDSSVQKKSSPVKTVVEEREKDSASTRQQQPPAVPKKPSTPYSAQNGSAKKEQITTSNDQSSPSSKRSSCVVEERTYEDRKKEWDEKQQMLARQSQLAAIRGSFKYEADVFYNFHLNEHAPDDSTIVPPVASPTPPGTPLQQHEAATSPTSSQPSSTIVLQNDGLPDAEETFAGLRNLSTSSTIRSAKGTVRGVKNRVRAGIATFLQIHDTKSYKEKEAGKVVVYTTTMGVVRETHQACMKVRNILRTLLVRCEERDVFMSRELQAELRERMRTPNVVVPQVFVDGQHVGDAETIERLNESGELRRIMKPFKDPAVCHTCQVCGGFRLLPCSVCNGSKKSVHRNHFTSEFVALKCMHCDEVGLVRCYACS